MATSVDVLACIYIHLMMHEFASSRCCNGKPLLFRWYGYPKAPLGFDLETAITKFITVLNAPNRDMNAYVVAMAKAECRHKLKLASLGQLTPSRHIKPIESANPPPLYEIRWQGITVRESNELGLFLDRRLLIRMYHSEPSEAPNHFIGHHIHEKLISGDASTWLTQNEEIATAIGFYRAGLPTNWGIGLANSSE